MVTLWIGHLPTLLRGRGPLPPLYFVDRGVAAALLEQVGLDGGVGAVRIAYDHVEAGRDDFVNPLLELAVKMLDIDGAGDEDGGHLLISTSAQTLHLLFFTKCC